jgi:hypothetical protein
VCDERMTIPSKAARVRDSDQCHTEPEQCPRHIASGSSNTTLSLSGCRIWKAERSCA